METTEFTKRFQRVKKPRVRYPTLAEYGRNAPQLHIWRLALQPAFKCWLQLIAVRTPIPEEFDDFDSLPNRRRAWRDYSIFVIEAHRRPLRDAVAGAGESGEHNCEHRERTKTACRERRRTHFAA